MKDILSAIKRQNIGKFIWDLKSNNNECYIAALMLCTNMICGVAKVLE